MAGSSKESKELKERRAKQLTQISEAILSLKSCQSSNLTNGEKFEVLDSTSEGMYEEIEMLTKKKPVDLATELMVEQINDIIKDIKELITDDAYIEKLEIFVAAGDQPEFRDVLFVLRQLRQGMERFGKKLEQEKQQVDVLLHEAEAAEIALTSFLGSDFVVTAKRFEELLGFTIPINWIRIVDHEEVFNFDRLDYIDIADYFKLS